MVLREAEAGQLGERAHLIDVALDMVGERFRRGWRRGRGAGRMDGGEELVAGRGGGVGDAEPVGARCDAAACQRRQPLRRRRVGLGVGEQPCAGGIELVFDVVGGVRPLVRLRLFRFPRVDRRSSALFGR